MKPAADAYIALGANLGHPGANLRTALTEIGRLRDTRMAAFSSFYRTAAVGGPPQPDYVNAVARIETLATPLELLDRLLDIEARHGRVRAEPNGPRSLDLDLLLHGSTVMATPRLTLPHPRMHARRFVLEPLAEIAPDLALPGHGRVSDLLRACAGQRVERMHGPRFIRADKHAAP